MVRVSAIAFLKCGDAARLNRGQFRSWSRRYLLLREGLAGRQAVSDSEKFGVNCGELSVNSAFSSMIKSMFVTIR